MYWFKKNLFFSVVIRIGFEFYLQFYFTSLYNLRNIKFKDVTDYYSIAVSVVWQLLPLVLLISTMIVLCKFKKKYKQEGIKDSRVRILLEDFKDNRKYLMVDHILFMIRRIFLSFLIVFGWQNGAIQVCVFFLICLGVLLWKLLMRPYKSVLLNIQNILFEFILLWVIGIFGSFYKRSTELSNSGIPRLLGIIWFWLIWSWIIINYIIVLTQAISLSIQKCLKPIQNPNQILPKPNELNHENIKAKINIAGILF